MKHLNKIGKAEINALNDCYQGNINEALKKVEAGYPIQYLIGYVDFYNTKIKVNKNVLIPRFETEYLVEKAIKYLKNKKVNSGIDICTGSGCIAIALKKNLDIDIDACDISILALDLAKVNAKENQTEINFFEKNILKENIEKKYDFIISNPPYVKKGEYTSPETKYEPQIALFANDNGLEFYKRILEQSLNILNPKGTIIFEIGATLGEDIKKIALDIYPKANIIIEKDYNHFDRFMFIET